MKKVFKVLGAVFLCTFLTLGAGIILLRCNNIYLPGQTVNGVDVSFQSKDKVWNDLMSKYSTSVTILETSGDTVEVPDVLNYPYDYLLTHTIKDWINRVPITVDMVPVVSDVLTKSLESRNKLPEDAYVMVNDANEWCLVRDVTGYSISPDEVISELESGNYIIDLNNYVLEADIKADDLMDKYLDLVWLTDFRIEYTKGLSITNEELKSMVDLETLEFTLDEEFLNEFVEKVADEYCTEYEYYKFTPTGETTPKSIPRGKRGTLGKVVKKTAEFEFLKNCILNKQSAVSRVPEMVGKDEFDDTYIEISIDAQHLWYYKDGELVSETDVVTGHSGRHDTPAGVYYISECIPGKYLIGDTYKTWVNYWMRLTNSGIGLHDATWRSKFGNKIYTYDGSHGCINLPKKFAKELFDEAYVGLPVIIY